MKNAHVAKEVNVTVQTVQRWMNDAKENLNKLTLIEENGRLKFEDTAENWEEFRRLAENARKFKPTSNLLEVKPDPKFFETFNDEEAIEIISDLESKKRINMKWIYLGEGANCWNLLATSESYKSSNIHKNILEEIFEICDERFGKKYSLIDIGPGNSLMVEDVIKKYRERIEKYVAVDVSGDMLNIASENIKKIFPNLKSEYYVCDVEKNIPKKISFNSNNIYMFLGGTVGNFENLNNVYKDIFDWMTSGESLIVQARIRDEKNLTFGSYYEKDKSIVFIPEMLGIDLKKSDRKYEIDYQKSSKSMYLVLDRDYNIDFSEKFPGKVVKFDKGERIKIFNYRMYNFIEIMQIVTEVGFVVDLYITNKEKTAYGIVLRKP